MELLQACSLREAARSSAWPHMLLLKLAAALQQSARAKVCLGCCCRSVLERILERLERLAFEPGPAREF